MAACVGVRDTDPDRIGDVPSPNYTQQDATISSEAQSYKSQADLDNDVTELKSPKLKACYETLLRTSALSSLPSGSTVNSVSVTITPGSGNVIEILSAALAVTSGGQDVTLYDDTATITGPLIEVSIDFENVGAQVPATLEQSVIAAVAARAAKG
jgi:hypothetical protein